MRNESRSQRAASQESGYQQQPVRASIPPRFPSPLPQSSSSFLLPLPLPLSSLLILLPLSSLLILLPLSSLLFLLLLSSPVAGQVLRGHVVDSLTQERIGRGFVILVDIEGRELERKLTLADGSFTFSLANRPEQSFRIRSERIGYRVAESGPFGATDINDILVRIRRIPTRLSNIEVSETSECRFRTEFTDLAWTEVRKALDAIVWTSAQQAYYISSNVYRRDNDRRGRRNGPESHRPHQGYMTAPFVSRDAAALSTEGYVVSRNTSWDFFAPDAGVLRSDDFSMEHCFRLVKNDDNDDVVGLSFEPLPSHTRPDVSGVLWLDRNTWELQTVRYSYTNLPPSLQSDDDIGGTITFMPLPSGAWIVRHWDITIPLEFREELVDRFDRRPRKTVEAFRHDGGEVLTVRDTSGAVAYQAEIATLVVIITEPTAVSAPTPTRNAIVGIAGTWFEGITSPDNVTVIEAPLDGEYDLTFSDRRTAILGAPHEAGSVRLTRGQIDTLRIARPSDELLMERVCEQPVFEPSRRVVVGNVTDAQTNRPVRNAQVTASWQDIQGNSLSTFSFSNDYSTSTTDASGFYAVCELQVGRPTLLMAETNYARSDLVRVAFERDGVDVGDRSFSSDLRFHRIDLVLSSQSTSGRVVTGLVTDAQTNRTISGANVIIVGQVAEHRTDTSGVFAITGLNVGTHDIIVSAPGYRQRRATVEIKKDQSTLLSREFTTLTPVAQVTGTVRDARSTVPIPGVWLTLVGPDADSVMTARADSTGAFILSASDAASYRIVTRSAGHQTTTIGPMLLAIETPHSIDVALTPLDPTLVRARRDSTSDRLVEVGFYERERRGRGAFLNPTTLAERAGGTRVGDLLRGMAGIQVDGRGNVRMRGIGAQCQSKGPSVWVDGVSFSSGSSSGGVDDWATITADELEALEVYARPTEIPAAFNTGGDAACGVVLLWTRRG